jgi:ketosteroid isomerase-like protein
MRRIKKVVLVSVIAAGCAPQQLSDADLAAIQDRFDQIAKHVLAEDNAGWANDFTPDGVFMAQNMPALRGRAAIRQWGENNGRLTSIAFSNIEVHGSGDLGYATGTYTLIAEGSATPDTGKFLVAMQRQPDGTWLHTVASVSSDLPAAGSNAP